MVFRQTIPTKSNSANSSQRELESRDSANSTYPYRDDNSTGHCLSSLYKKHNREWIDRFFGVVCIYEDVSTCRFCALWYEVTGV